MSTTPPTLPPAPLSPALLRQFFGVSQAHAAVMAGVGVSTVRIFDIDPSEIKDERKRRALEAYYARLRVMVLRAK